MMALSGVLIEPGVNDGLSCLMALRGVNQQYSILI